MNITSKSRYALKIMMDLAHYAGPDGSSARDALIRRSDIVRRQGIPPEYLDQIMMRLRGADLVHSTRGRTGGYRLGKTAESITLWDLFQAVEDNIYPAGCVAHGDRCEYTMSCTTRGAWNEIFNSMKAPLQAITLAEATSKWADEHRMCPAGGIRECKGS